MTTQPQPPGQSEEERIGQILDGFGMYAMWRGYDEAMGTIGKHTSSEPSEAKADATAALLSLLRDARKEELGDMIRISHLANRVPVIESWAEERIAQLAPKGGNDE